MNTHFDIAIIGAGFAGIIAALQLKKAGYHSFVIFERAADLGGTWRDNTYPGCACDVPAHLYSIADEPNPYWSNLFAGQAEIWAYMHTVANKNKLGEHIIFNTDIVQQHFIADKGQWQLNDRKGNVYSARIVIMATGPLNRAYTPTIKGMDLFGGKQMHSANWDANYDLTDKRVAVIGTGASAIQIVPAIAAQVTQLTVFQRTPAWIMARNDRKIDTATQQRFAKYPRLQRALREFIYSLLEFRGRMFVGNKWIHKIGTRQALKKLEREVIDPQVRQKLTPKYQLGCKRILASDDYLPTFNRANVTLETDAIGEITPTGIVTQSGKQYALDTIIYSTGFVASEIQTDAQITGLNGQSLFEQWQQTGLQAYRGTTVAGYPNLLFVLGPNTGLGHNSVLHMMESQLNYIVQYIDFLLKNKQLSYLDIQADVQANYNKSLQYLFKGTVWDSGCKSWYLNSQGQNTTLYPRLTREFRRETKQFVAAEYIGV
jgi:cation diffusion facilitator CzcD-associated flavoprotein CzcO